MLLNDFIKLEGKIATIITVIILLVIVIIIIYDLSDIKKKITTYKLIIFLTSFTIAISSHVMLFNTIIKDK